MVSSLRCGERAAPPKRHKSTTAIDLLGCALVGAPAWAETFTVNDAGDNGEGVCDATQCTLREAVAAAENEIAHPGADVFEIAADIDPVLTQAVEITITTAVAIRGQGPI